MVDGTTREGKWAVQDGRDSRSRGPTAQMARLSLLLLVYVAVPATALVTRPSPPALRLRGGLGDIDPNMVAKVATGLGSVQAVFTALAPEKAGQVANHLTLFVESQAASPKLSR